MCRADGLSAPLLSFADRRPSAAYALPLHDALPISRSSRPLMADPNMRRAFNLVLDRNARARGPGARVPIEHEVERPPHRLEEHTAELQSPLELLCRLPLYKKNLCKGRSTCKRTGDC